MNVGQRRFLALIAGAAFLLAACSSVSDSANVLTSSVRGYAPTTSANPYPDKDDVHFHDGVERAHRMPVQGIDVSRWQGDIDWHRVRAAGTRFAFIKATEGGLHLDPSFHTNWENARRAGVPRGAYHFVFWCRSAEEQAAWFIENVPNEPDALPPVLDLEWNSHSRNCTRRVPREEALAKARYILAAMERHYGKMPIIYTDINFHRDVLEGEHFDNPFWLRSVAAEPHERYRNRGWTFWQWTQTGTVPGIRGEVDRNAFYGTEREWQQFLATGCDPRDLDRLRGRGVCAMK
jgi:lysozyme